MDIKNKSMRCGGQPKVAAIIEKIKLHNSRKDVQTSKIDIREFLKNLDND